MMMVVARRVLFISLALFFLFSVVSSFRGDPRIRQVVDGKGFRAEERQFVEFQRTFRKAYPSEEERGYRFNVFRSNLHRARRNQVMDPSAVHGVTRFSDLTPAEFRHSVLSLRGALGLPPMAMNVASYMQTYVGGGVSCPLECVSSRRLNQGLVVGFGSRKYEGPYWIIKNSLGKNWLYQDHGFYQLCQGKNVCGVDSLMADRHPHRKPAIN